MDISYEVKDNRDNLGPAKSLEEGKEFLDLSNNDPEVGGVVEEVSKHILLPAKEFTVATVNDANKLKQSNPILFQYIKNGQKLLVYETGIIVYDSVLDKVVDVIQYYPIRSQQLEEAVSSALPENK